jgi:hypothetical protein
VPWKIRSDHPVTGSLQLEYLMIKNATMRGISVKQ